MNSCGLLLYRSDDDGVVWVLVGHMGGPFWARKDRGAWSIPKGIAEAGELDLVAVAEREFAEEMGQPAPAGDTIDLGTSRSGSKTVHVFARPGDFDLALFSSNEFEMEWPRGSGQIQSFPEIDRAGWVTVGQARDLLVKSQLVFIDRLVDRI